MDKTTDLMSSPVLVAIAAAVMAVSLAATILRYLRTDRRRSEYFDKDFYAKVIKKRESQTFKKFQEQIDSVRAELDSIRSIKMSKAALDAAQQRLTSTLVNTTAEDILENIKQKIQLNLEKKNVSSEIDEAFLTTLERLDLEVRSLGKRGNLNLVLGIITTMVGLGIFAYLVFYGTQERLQEPWLIVAYYLPRISLVILIEVFAYFFLNLYKNSLSDIKYFQNEMTNIEAKSASVHFAFVHGNPETISFILSGLSTTDRNLISNQRDAGKHIENDNQSSETIKKFFESLSDFVKLTKKSK